MYACVANSKFCTIQAANKKNDNTEVVIPFTSAFLLITITTTMPNFVLLYPIIVH